MNNLALNSNFTFTHQSIHAASFPERDRLIIQQISRDQEMQKLAKIPVWAPTTIALLIFVYVLFIASSYFWLQGVFPTWVMLACNVYAIYCAFFIWHEGTHRSISSNKIINDVIGTIGGQLLTPTMPVATYRVLHLQHHRNTGEHTADPDDFLVTTPTWLMPILFPFVDLCWAVWYMRFHQHRPLKEKKLMLCSGITYLIWYIFWFSTNYWQEFLWIYVLPQRLNYFCTAYMFARIQHPRGIKQREHPFQGTVVNPDNFFYRGLLYMGNGYHLVHHLWPSMPFYRLRRSWLILREYLQQHNIPYIERRVFEGASDYNIPPPVAENFMMSISSIEEITATIKLFTFKALNNQQIPKVNAGAHLTVLIEQFVRHYSIINPGAIDSYQIAVKREDNGKGGSIAMHKLKVGDSLKIEKISNYFFIRPTDKAARTILIAGGIGITPLLAMAKSMLGKRQFSLHLAVRDYSQAPLTLWNNNSQLINCSYLYCDDPKQKATIHPGFVDQGKFNPQKVLTNYRPGDQIYLCGPEAMIEGVKSSAINLGFPREAIFSEYFAISQTAENLPFTLKLNSNNLIIEVNEQMSALEALEAAGIAVDNVCRQGICGACRCKVLAGDIEHRDVVLNLEERSNTMTLCISRGRAGQTLLLDL